MVARPAGRSVLDRPVGQTSSGAHATAHWTAGRAICRGGAHV